MQDIQSIAALAIVFLTVTVMTAARFRKKGSGCHGDCCSSETPHSPSPAKNPKK